MKKLIYFLSVLSCFVSFGQNLKIIPTKIDSIAIDADFFIGFDSFKSCYYIKNNVLFKKIGDSNLQYQNSSFGKITKVDILNPLKIIVFYEEFNMVLILDNQLNEIQKIDFSKLETLVVASAIGISGQNKLWVFNTLNQQIGLYDLNSNTYQNLGMPINENIRFYQTDFNYFQWIDKQNKWNTCSIYGKLFFNGKVETASIIQLLIENKILFSIDNLLFIKEQNTNKLYEIEIFEKSFKNFYYKDQILSIFTNKGITNYKITIP